MKSLCTVLFLLGMVLPVFAQDVSKEELKVIVIRNVVIPNNVDDTPGSTVNIVIKNGVLDIVTEDAVPLEAADVTYDASGGVLIGQLDLGLEPGERLRAGFASQPS